ncbi:hypothetical protein PCNPT3_07100 [Psychromonas sp. CNPT3]|uniref:hypothetical protein n=1 Tax=Psychromonas sp. CNPT3 TaxID=314282 RepID=UPI00006E9D23|nr:hypothetical protein [Psychromonas sp. CNPT3]AGH81358.1 hypothetical protein PCNPT3_07100 [Psychromonas sp. CNPT3]
MLQALLLITLFFSFNCFAKAIPANALQVEFQQSNAIDNKVPRTTLDSLYALPKNTYTYISDVLGSFYNVVTLRKAKKREDVLHSSAFSIPLINDHKKGFQFEVFGRLSDPSLDYLSNLSADHALYNYISNTRQVDINDYDLSLGAGVSFQTGENSRIKLIISNSEIPGFGDSTTLLGFETRF